MLIMMQKYGFIAWLKMNKPGLPGEKTFLGSLGEY
jgi:hypothetical protein